MSTNNSVHQPAIQEELTTDLTEESSTISALQLVLAEKRTSLSVLRTGISVFALPLAVVSALIATSKYYQASEVLHLLVPAILICAGLVLLGDYLVGGALKRIHRQDALLSKLKRSHHKLAPLLE